MKSPRRIAFVSSFFLLASPAFAAINIYLSPDQIESAESSGITGVTTETFEGRNTGYLGTYNSAVGTYSGNSYVINENMYGGLNEGKYLGIYTYDNATLTLPESVAYFGFYFSAGDKGNMVELLSGGKVILTFKTADLIRLLPNTVGTQIQAVNGSYYNTRDYWGQPGSNRNTNGGEPYAYVHFFGAEGTTFDQVRFTEIDTATFETDNHSIRKTAPTLPSTLVDITHAVPEPSGALLALLSGSAFAFRRRRA